VRTSPPDLMWAAGVFHAQGAKLYKGSAYVSSCPESDTLVVSACATNRAGLATADPNGRTVWSCGYTWRRKHASAPASDMLPRIMYAACILP